MIVTLAHLALVRGFSAKPGFCRWGARQWFARYGLDWNAFRHAGIEADVLLATGDPMAAALVKAAADSMEAAHGRQ